MVGGLLLLDTNILSNIIRYPLHPAALRFRESLDSRICTSIIVQAELYFGAAKVGSSGLRRRIDAAIASIDVLPLDDPFADHYADIRSYLEHVGRPIGPNDLFIAAHARSLGATLVTANTREFSRVPNLHVENWLD